LVFVIFQIVLSLVFTTGLIDAEDKSLMKKLAIINAIKIEIGFQQQKKKKEIVKRKI